MRIYRYVCVTLILVVVSAAPGFAQSMDPRGGIEVGAGATYLTVPKNTSRSTGAGFIGGAFVVLPITTMYKLQPEIHYEYRQSKVLGGERKFGYVSVPVLVRMSLFKGLYVTEGQAFHAPVSAKVAGHSVKGNTRADISIVIGVGKRAGRVALEGRWDSGIRQVQKTVQPGDAPTRHRSITGLVVIPLGG